MTSVPERALDELNRQRVALLAGDLNGIPTQMDLESLLRRTGSEAGSAALQQVRAGLRRNGILLEAALKGLRDARARLGSSTPETTTYTARGRTQRLGGPGQTMLHRA